MEKVFCGKHNKGQKEIEEKSQNEFNFPKTQRFQLIIAVRK